MPTFTARIAIIVSLCALGLTATAQTPPAPLNDAARSAVIARIVDALHNVYIFPDTGEKAAAKLQSQLASGAYTDLAAPRAFADKLSADLYEVTKDKHMEVNAPGRALAPAATPPPRAEGGVISNSVSQTTGEFGIRIALGAEPRDVLRSVMRQMISLCALGTTLGLFGSLAFSRLMNGLVFEVSPYDPITLGSSALVLLMAATAASLIPAMRATRINPISCLRHE